MREGQPSLGVSLGCCARGTSANTGWGQGCKCAGQIWSLKVSARPGAFQTMASLTNVDSPRGPDSPMLTLGFPDRRVPWSPGHQPGGLDSPCQHEGLSGPPAGSAWPPFFSVALPLCRTHDVGGPGAWQGALLLWVQGLRRGVQGESLGSDGSPLWPRGSGALAFLWAKEQSLNSGRGMS